MSCSAPSESETILARISRRRGSVVIALLAAIGTGCSSNKFELANDRNRFDPLVAGPPPAGGPVPLYPGPPPGGPQGGPMGPGPVAAIGPAPLADNPNPYQTGAVNQRRLVATPPPGDPGTDQRREADGPELAGRIVDSQGRPASLASVQALDPSRARRVVAEIAADSNGSFRIFNLLPGVQYELIATANQGGRRLIGRQVAVPPDTAVIIQIDYESANADSPLGHRLSADQHARDLAKASRPTPRPIPAPSRAILIDTPAMVGATRALQQSPAMQEDERPIAEARAVEPAQNPPSQSEPDELTPPARTPARSAAYVPPASSAFAGSPLETATLLTASKRPVELRELQGKLILFDFCASWCGPCRRAVPELNSLEDRYSGGGLEVIAVACENGDTETAIASAERMRQSLGIRYTVLTAPMDVPSVLRDHFRVESYPTLVLLDRQGKVLFRATGADAATFRRLDAAIAGAMSQSR